MLDVKRIRENLDEIKLLMGRRGEGEFDPKDLDEVLDLDDKRKAILKEVEVLKNKSNVDSKKIPVMMKNGENIDEIKAELKVLSDKIKEFDVELREVEEKLVYRLMRIPNVPHPDVPQGETDEDNVEIRRWGEPTKFDFEHKAHWDIGTDLDILDFERGGKITGSRFTVLKGLGSKLERSLIGFFLDQHTENNGYTEVIPPFIANRNSFIGTGQLPKFEEDMFKLEGLEYFLVPTAEVPVTNLVRDEIIDEESLPLKLTAHTPCFRSEAGSYGRDTRGLIRMHQFEKVEMVQIVAPEKSMEALEELTGHAEKVLQLLNLPYRKVLLCTGDMGFGSCKTYDLEVWLPAQNTYREISSCSNMWDFQARRMQARCKSRGDKKTRFVHTLNGSGLAVGRTLVAVLENYQNADGSITVPEVLRPYMGGLEVISA